MQTKLWDLTVSHTLQLGIQQGFQKIVFQSETGFYYAMKH